MTKKLAKNSKNAHCVLRDIDAMRLDAARQLDPTRKVELGQFMTPTIIANFMASFFTPSLQPIRLLDAGAGVGSLTSAFINHHQLSSIDVEAWEIDPKLRFYLTSILSKSRVNNSHVSAVIHSNDFIEEAVTNLATNKGKRFNRAILNPPYKKINSNSSHRLLLRKVGIETVNLYTAFVALSILMMESRGEVVAIIPRSFCNGTYYRPFRELLLFHCAIKRIHLFGSRKKAFKDDGVLQENIIIHLVKDAPQEKVIVSTSHDLQFHDLAQKMYSFDEIVKQNDAQSFIHIPTLETSKIASPLFVKTLSDIGLEVCTGPIVDFRMKTYLSKEFQQETTVPLLYPHHFTRGELLYPRDHKKPNAIILCPEIVKWLMPQGFYVLVKRFSAKEERRRITAYVVDPEKLLSSYYGFENHWNVFHIKKHGLDKSIAYGLMAFLNSTVVDNCFRVFSGHTQVNATDLRSIKYPPIEKLQMLGNLTSGYKFSQEQLDNLIEKFEMNMQSSNESWGQSLRIKTEVVTIE